MNFKPSFPVLVLVAAYLISAFVVFTRQAKVDPPGIITLRLGHWQLESGFREGINQAANDYQQLHPNVRVVQEAVPESTWKQWVSTQLMGGTASDILEIGNMEPNLTTIFYVRYFLSISSIVGQPNPYNAGTGLAGVPFIKTFKDGLRTSYINETQAFMSVPLSLIGVRLFYNRTLYTKLTGQKDPPTDYRAFLAACQTIEQQTIKSGLGQGDHYVPIAGSAWHFGRWNESVFVPLSSSALIDNDLNRDGRLSKEEMYLGFRLGRLSMQSPPYTAMLNFMGEITRYFQTGYTGLTRDEALFLFAQQRAVFIPTGSYEAVSLRNQAAGKFEIGVMNFPYPTAADPEFGSVVEGPRYESIDGAAQFGITRGSKHPDVALDFLRFLTSQKENEKINRKFGWIPVIEGTQVDPTLKAFEPNLDGVIGAFDVSLGADTTIRWQQVLSLFQVRQLTEAQLAGPFDSYYRQTGPVEFEEAFREARRAYARNTQLLIAQRSRCQGQAPDSPGWILYRKILFGQLIGPETEIREQRALEKAGPANLEFPYRYKSEALDNVRRHLAAPPLTKASP